MDRLYDLLEGDLPPPSRPVIHRLLRDPLRDVTVVRSEVEAYLGWVQHVAEQPAQKRRAEQIATACLRLLDALTPTTGEAHRRLVQAACLYFVAVEDDLDSTTGFDDDAEVVGAIAEFIGRPDIWVGEA